MGNYLLTKVLEGILCSFYWKLTSNQSIGRETLKFCGKLLSKQSIGSETKQFYGKLTSNQSFGGGNNAVFIGN